MFRNYVRDSWTNTPLNLATARIILSGYLIWVLVSIEWGQLSRYPPTRTASDTEPFQVLIPEVVLLYVDLLVLVTVLLLLMVAIGAYLQYSGYLASLLVCYFGVLRFQVDVTWSTQMFFAAGLLLMFYALYSDRDELSVDGLRRTSHTGLNGLNAHLKRPVGSRRYRASPLRVFLLALGLLYFGSGLGKLVVGGPGWMTATNLGRNVFRPIQYGYAPGLRDVILQFELLLLALAVGTIVLELGFLVSILTNRLFDAFILSLLAFHIGIALTMGPIFVYTIVFLLLFLDWRRIASAITPSDDLIVAYDEHCFACARSLYFFKYLDVTDTVEFYSQSNVAPGSERIEGVDFDRSIHLINGGDVYEGYNALRELCRRLGVLYPIYVLLWIPPVPSLGRRVYRRLTADRSRTLSVPTDDL